MLTTTLTGLATSGGVVSGRELEAAGVTAGMFVLSGVAGTYLGNLTDEVKEVLCNDKTQYGNTDIRQPTNQV